jgi:hypothetical protein
MYLASFYAFRFFKIPSLQRTKVDFFGSLILSKSDLRVHFGLVLVDKREHNKARKPRERRRIIMEKVKEMPYEEKFAMVIDDMKLNETVFLHWVQKHLGDQAVAEFRTTYQEVTKPIPEEASIKEKYEIAYGNWIGLGRGVYSFARKKMGEEGIKTLERAQVEALKQKSANPALFLLGLIRIFSPGLAFTMTARKMAYQLQWVDPSLAFELSQHKAVFNMPNCKILGFPETEDICLIGCQRVYSTWEAEQFKMKSEYKRQGKSCTCSKTPLR